MLPLVIIVFQPFYGFIAGAVGYIQQVLNKLKLFTETGSKKEAASVDEKEKPEQLLEEVTFEGVANYIKNGKCKLRSEQTTDVYVLHCGNSLW